MNNRLAPLLLVLAQGCGCTVVDPGNRGVKVHLGEVSQQALPEGLQWHEPFLTSIENVSIQQFAEDMDTDCYSSDLQYVKAKLKVLYRVPEANVVTIFQKYNGKPFGQLISPRVNEALKEATATLSAEGIVHNREKIKAETLALARKKVGDIMIIDDLVIENLDLSKQLEDAIEAKMTQQQRAQQAEFTKQQAKVEAETAVIRAQGEADAIRIRGAAIRDNPKLIDLQVAEKWNGVAPLVVGGNNANILLPVNHEASK